MGWVRVREKKIVARKVAVIVKSAKRAEPRDKPSDGIEGLRTLDVRDNPDISKINFSKRA